MTCSVDLTSTCFNPWIHVWPFSPCRMIRFAAATFSKSLEENILREGRLLPYLLVINLQHGYSDTVFDVSFFLIGRFEQLSDGSLIYPGIRSRPLNLRPPQRQTTYLHCVGLPTARVTIGKDTDIISIDTTGYYGGDLLKYLKKPK